MSTLYLPVRLTSRARHDGAQDEAREQRQRLESGLGGADLLDRLEPQRQVHDGAEEPIAVRNDGQDGDRVAPVRGTGARGTIGSAARDSTNRNMTPKTSDTSSAPPTHGSVQSAWSDLIGQADEQGSDDRHREHDRAQVVQVARELLAMDVGQEAIDDREGDQADGQVDEEDPVPAEVLRQPAAQQRAEDGRDAEHGAEQALVLAALAGREQVTDDRERDGEDGAGADTLDAPEER